MGAPPRFGFKTKFDGILGYFTWPRLYTNMVDIYKDGSVFVEVGVYQGRSLYFLLKVIKDKRKNIKVIGVDHYKEQSENFYQKTLENLSEFNGRYEIKNMTSAAASKLFENNSIDFVFIDAGHTYKDVKADIIWWLPKIKKGGVIAGHDYNGFNYSGGYPGVKQAVNEVFKGGINEDYMHEDCWLVKIN